MRFSDLPNIGPAVEKQLIDSGTPDFAALKAKGSKQAWLDIQRIDSSACIHRLLSLEGAIRGVRKKDLPENVKADLRAFYSSNKI